MRILLLRGVGFFISNYSYVLYHKTVNRLPVGLYVCTMYKNGSDVQVCIDASSLILPQEPVLSERPDQQKKM